ncbi:MAG: hypothetical protein A2020_03565 [Lentisphaerae bacterium GWF2_45_14]|nr:MAG: hypothetical protein A2020_03565 [Lentisphaerae bacterium GWF2_45_14]
MSKRKILLHACCAPCAAPCCEKLLKENFDLTLFFSNSNISPFSEYEKRRNELERLAKLMGVPLEIDSYEHEDWLRAVAGLENEFEKGPRCTECFKHNLRRASEKAESLGIESFSTTLTISPHKDSTVIFKAASSYPCFIPFDFKKNNGFARSIELSRQFGLYRQGYCGCEFSNSQQAFNKKN